MPETNKVSNVNYSVQSNLDYPHSLGDKQKLWITENMKIGVDFTLLPSFMLNFNNFLLACILDSLS